MEESIAVACYAGQRYPQRPRQVLWHGAWREVATVEREWAEPGRRLFLVRLALRQALRVRSPLRGQGERGFDRLTTRLRLCYDEARDEWLAID